MKSSSVGLATCFNFFVKHHLLASMRQLSPNCTSSNYMLPTPVAKEKPSEKPTKNPGNDSKKGRKGEGLELEAVVAKAVMEEIWNRPFARGLEGLLFLQQWREEAMLCI